MHVPQPHFSCEKWFGLLRFRSPLLTQSLNCFLFLRVLRWFNSPGSLIRDYLFISLFTIASEGCPIRTSPDQSLLGGSPRLFAAYHVLHRFLMPRHPPFALNLLYLRLTVLKKSEPKNSKIKITNSDPETMPFGSAPFKEVDFRFVQMRNSNPDLL
jgi:hypothetical protein